MRRRPSRRRFLLVLVAATLAVVVADVADWPAATRLRGAGAAVLGPLERLAGGERPGTLDRDAAAGRVRAGLETAELGRGLEEARRLRELLDSPGASGARFVPARVVAVGAHGASGPERVTIDVGSRDGVGPDLTVVAAEGLVGRVVSTGPWTSDVLVVGSADLSVGVRVGSAGTLGSLTGATGAAGSQPRPAGRLGLALVERGTLQVGDAVRTMGSVGGRPFVAGIPVGRVTAVDPAGGRFAATGAVTPSVDVTSLDIVGVLLSSPRTSPRAPVQGGPG
jgi:rod shape-determining protein MreC